MILKIAVKDASVLIDLISADLLGQWFKLGIETHVTDFVLEEIRRPGQRLVVDSFVNAGLIHVAELASGSVQELTVLSALSRELNVSIPDASAVRLAERLENGFLLTSDGLLRRGTERRGVEVRGFLWILDLLLWKEMTTFLQSIAALDAVLATHSRQPAGECTKRKEAWVAGKKIKPREPIPASNDQSS